MIQIDSTVLLKSIKTEKNYSFDKSMSFFSLIEAVMVVFELEMRTRKNFVVLPNSKK